MPTPDYILEKLRKAREPRAKKVPKPIAKYSKKRVKQIEQEKITAELDKEFYLEHYRACPHSCEVCKVKLPKEPSNFMFHHILEKRNYPQFRHAHENILVVCLQCHTQIENDISKVPYAVKRRNEVEKLLLT